MTIERTVQGWNVYSTEPGYLFQRHYIGYTKAEALALFRAELRRL